MKLLVVVRRNGRVTTITTVLAVASLIVTDLCQAFLLPTTGGIPKATTTSSSSSSSGIFGAGRMSSDLGLPCEEECALESFPNLPLSVNPGVVTGQALLDLLNHAKENGKSYVY
jgi:hypothetical protein